MLHSCMLSWLAPSWDGACPYINQHALLPHETHQNYDTIGQAQVMIAAHGDVNMKNLNFNPTPSTKTSYAAIGIHSTSAQDEKHEHHH